MKSHVTIFFLCLILLRVEKVLSLEPIDHQSNVYYLYAVCAGTALALVNGIALLPIHSWDLELLLVFEQAGGVAGLIAAAAIGTTAGVGAAGVLGGAGVGVGVGLKVINLLSRRLAQN